MKMIVQALTRVAQPSTVIILNTRGGVGDAVAYLQSIDYVSDAGVVPEGCRVIFADLGDIPTFSIATAHVDCSGWILKQFFKKPENSDFSIQMHTLPA